jgi:integrase/recombinase XerD
MVLVRGERGRVPELVGDAGQDTSIKYLEFFAAHIRNPNTRAAYLTAAEKFFAWCGPHRIGPLKSIRRLHVAAYIECLTEVHAAPTVKQNLAALRMLFTFLRIPFENPAEGVRGPKHVVRTGRTPVLAGEQARHLLDSIDPGSLTGLRDRALIAVMVYSFGRVSAVVGMDAQDYYLHGTRRWIRLHEKGGKEHAVPLHHNAEELLEAYLAASNVSDGPLFRVTQGGVSVTDRRLTRFAAWEMVKRRAKAAGLPAGTTNHTFRATGITVYLENGGTIENARNIAAHASIKTTQTYDRRGERITLDEISRIRL